MNCTCHDGKNDCKKHWGLHGLSTQFAKTRGDTPDDLQILSPADLKKIRKQAVQDCIKFMEDQRELMTARDSVMLGSEAIDAAKEYLAKLDQK